MSKRFAAARKGRPAVLSRLICHAASMDAANDDGNDNGGNGSHNDNCAADGAQVAKAPARRSAGTNARFAAAPPSSLTPSLEAALHHFARHGLGAARVAHENASHAARAGDRDGRAAWIEICRQFDRRLARTVDPA